MLKHLLAAFLLLGVVAVPVLPTQAQDELSREVVEVSLGGSTILKLGGASGRVTLTDPSIADVTASGGDLLLIGRRVGETNLIMYGANDRSTWLIKVTLPARAIQSELTRMFPGQDIQARAVGGALVLVGIVDSSPTVTQAEELALGYLRSPSIAALGVEPHVINLLKVKTRQQVQLEVRFAEVNRRSMRAIGINMVGGSGDGRAGLAVGRDALTDTDPRPKSNSIVPQSTIVGHPNQVFSPSSNSVGAFFVGMRNGRFPFAATLNLLAQNNLSRTLAEPTLVAMSGQEASFLAGGEFPYEKSTGFGNTSVEFKKFGIELAFNPTVLGDDTIQMRTSVSVSAPDPTLTITSNGVPTEGFKRRASETTIRLRDGQSFAIAGLLEDQMENMIEKVPGLGDLPILGLLFSSKEFIRKETELVVIVTARLVEPIDEGDLPPLPGEATVSDPTDLELFLLNVTEVDEPSMKSRSAGPSATSGRQPVGKVGFWR